MLIGLTVISIEHVFAEDDISIFVENNARKVYYTGENITSASFDPKSNSIIFETGNNAKLDIKAPQVYKYGGQLFFLRNGEEVLPEIRIDDCFYYVSFETQMPEKIELIFTHWPEATEQIENCETITISSPLKQFKSGIHPEDVKCKESLILVTKYDGFPACIKPESYAKLILRGWALVPKYIPGEMPKGIEIPDDVDVKEFEQIMKENDSKINVMCMTLEKSKGTATFFKVPSYLPDGYSFKCSFSGTPYESYMIFHNKKVPDEWVSNYPQLISDGAIFIHQTDEKSAVGEKEFATYGTAEQRIQETYDSVINGNPSLKPQLIRINGMLAYAVDSCSDCGVQTANFTDGTIIQKSTFTEAKIKFIDENGVKYFLEAGIPLNELIKVVESLQRGLKNEN